MEKDDQAARRARAASLRERIARITNPDSSRGEKLRQDSPADTPSKESAREFVERRMRELDKKKP